MILEGFYVRLAEAIGLGIAVALILWLLRGFAAVRRVRVSALLAAVMLGVYVLLKGSGLPGEVWLLQVVTALAVMLAANAALQLLDLLLWDYALGTRRHMVVPRLLVDIFNFLALTGVALAVLKIVFNADLNALLLTSTVVSAVIGLSLQDMLSNVVAGLALQLEHPFSVGDWVLVSEQEGQVMQMNWRTLTLRTRDNHTILLPNGNVARKDIINYSRPTPLQRLHAHVGVAYRHPPGAVKEALIRVAVQAEGVSREPQPDVVVTAYGDFAIQYDLRFWITDYNRAPQIHDAVMSGIWYEFRRAGLTIPFPIRDVTMRTLSDDHEARAQEQLRQELFAELRPLPFFAPLSDEQIAQMARGAVLQRYAAGEVLVRQGDPGDSLFVINSGRVRVQINGQNSQVVPVANLGPNEFFGEMSLLTGEPRSAWVIAEAETEVVVVDKADVAPLLKSDVSLLEAISVALEARSRSRAEYAARSTGPLAEQAPQRAALVRRIRGFFGIRT